MLGSRRVREVTCPSCAATWPRRTSRFCGACGTSLTASTAGSHLAEGGPPDEDELAGDRRYGVRSRRLELIAAAVLVVIVGIAITIAASVSEPPLDTGSDHVELPAPDELPDEDPDAPPDGALQDRDPASEEARSNDVPLRGPTTITCVPAGCERWRTELPDGSVIPAHDLLIHVERKVGPPTDWPDESREEPSRAFALLTALDPSDGRIVWDRQLEKPHLTEPGVQVQVLPVDESLVLVLWGRQIFALDAPTGERRWGTFRAPAARPDRPGVDGEVVVWWPDAVGDGHDHADQPDAGRSLTAPPGALTSLDRRSGAVGWRISTRLVMFAHGQAVTLSEDGTTLAGIDLEDRRRVWSRELTLPGEREPQVLTEGRLALLSDGSIEVIDTASGETVARRELSLPEVFDVEVIGTTAVVHRSQEPPPMASAGSARSSVYLQDLTDPDRPPRQVGDVVAVQPLPTRSPTGGTPWERAPTAGLAIVTQPDDTVHLTVLDSDGAIPSTTDPGQGRVIDLPAERTVTAVLGSQGQVVVAHGEEGVDHSPWLISGDARAEVQGHAEVVTAEPELVIRTADGLVGLDLGQDTDAS